MMGRCRDGIFFFDYFIWQAGWVREFATAITRRLLLGG